MGIYINGIEMPKSKSICIIIDPAGQVRHYDLNNDKYADNELFEAVSIPSYGSLIEKHDVFKLISAFPEVDQFLPVEFMNALYNLPTIIPASEEGE